MLAELPKDHVGPESDPVQLQKDILATILTKNDAAGIQNPTTDIIPGTTTPVKEAKPKVRLPKLKTGSTCR